MARIDQGRSTYVSAPILAPRPTVPPVLYVGGPLHATLWHAEAGQTEPDPIHQHVTANGEVVGYARQPFNYDMREPTNPQVILQRWTMWLYLERELTGQQPDIVMQVVTDAMFRWFTTTHGKLATDQELYNRLNSMADRLDKLTAALNQGEGTAGQLLHDKQLYENMNGAVTELHNLVKDIRADPKRYLNVKVSIF